MNAHVEKAFADGKRTLVPFVTAGDPDLESLAPTVKAIEKAGASVVEIGIPFSDPVADGPVIQAAMQRALERDVRLSKIWQSLKEIRSECNAAWIAMVSASIVWRQGLDAFCQQAKDAGIDGLIVPDAPFEESQVLRDACDQHGLTLTLLVAPSTPIDRGIEIAKMCTGFVYVVVRAGLTGVSQSLPEDLADRLKALSAAGRPLAAGFGIGTPEQVTEVLKHAQGAIVGSALVIELSKAAENNESVPDAAYRFVSYLQTGADNV